MSHTLTDDTITAELVRDLMRDQHPDLADRPVGLGARGWDNQLWRLGDDLAVRLPWATQRADELLRKEYAWVPTLAPRRPLPVPVPQRLGEPSDRFPRPWIITTWVRGEPADRAPATRGAQAADALAAFLTALHRPAPDGAPVAHDAGLVGRGGPLADRGDQLARTARSGHRARARPRPGRCARGLGERRRRTHLGPARRRRPATTRRDGLTLIPLLGPARRAHDEGPHPPP